MSPEMPLDDLLQTIHSFDRNQCIDELTHFKSFPLDFDEGYLDKLSLEKLRHVLMAAYVTARNKAQRAAAS